MADSYGAKVWYDPAAGTTFAELADLVEGDAVAAKMNFQRLKSLGQANRYTTVRGNFIDGGTLKLKLVFTKAKMTTLMAELEDPAPGAMRIEFPDLDDTSAPVDVSRFGFNAKLVELGLPLPAEGGRLEADTTWEVSGAITFTAATTATS